MSCIQQFRAISFCALCALQVAGLVGCGAKAEPFASKAMVESSSQSSSGDTQSSADELVPLAEQESFNGANAAPVDLSKRYHLPARKVSPRDEQTAPKSMSEEMSVVAGGPISAADPLAIQTNSSAEFAESPQREAHSAESPKSASGEMVEVFFATDRLPTSELMPSALRNFAPVTIVWMICATLFIGFSLAKRFKGMWLVGCGLSVCLGMSVLHAAVIRWQQYARLSNNSETRFSALRDDEVRDYPLHLGSARVSLPATHKPGRFEQPQLIHFEFVESPEKHIVLYSLKVEDASSTWFDSLSAAAQNSDNRDGFVFIHGYNVRFIDALKRTAQLASDLDLQGPAICYSWPSRGNVAAYTVDEASVSWSAPHFEQLLLDLHSRTQCNRIHVVAHSMGNRALLQAIERIDLRHHRPNHDRVSPEPNGSEAKLIDSIVMAAPDVDLAEFASRYVKPLQNISGRTTLYFSDSDRALLLSSGIHGAPRLGLLKDHLQSFAGIESIYVGIERRLTLGHSYYGDDPAVIEDLKSLLRSGQSAAQRDLLQQVSNARGISFWRIDPTRQANRVSHQHR